MYSMPGRTVLSAKLGAAPWKTVETALLPRAARRTTILSPGLDDLQRTTSAAVLLETETPRRAGGVAS
jgi:hypothetical protein